MASSALTSVFPCWLPSLMLAAAAAVAVAQGDAMSMPAPAPRSRLSSGGAAGAATDGSPMDTGDGVDGVDLGAISAGIGSFKADDEGR